MVAILSMGLSVSATKPDQKQASSTLLLFQRRWKLIYLTIRSSKKNCSYVIPLVLKILKDQNMTLQIKRVSSMLSNVATPWESSFWYPIVPWTWVIVEWKALEQLPKLSVNYALCISRYTNQWKYISMKLSHLIIRKSLKIFKAWSTTLARCRSAVN